MERLHLYEGPTQDLPGLEATSKALLSNTRVHQTVSTTPPRRKGGVFPALSVGFTCNPAVTQRVHWAP